jgi:hypothetical protein
MHSALAFTAAPSIKTKAGTKSGPGLLTRFYTALMAARLRAAEREVARYLADHGGKFTDEAEREIERRFLSNQSRW